VTRTSPTSLGLRVGAQFSEGPFRRIPSTCPDLTEQPTDPTEPAGAFAEVEGEENLPLTEVGELFQTLGKALRAFQLYDENNPVYKRFVSSLSEAFTGLWGELNKLHVSVEEDRFALAGQEVYRSVSRSDSLSFLFYKDGVREVVFSPGFEHEVEKLLGVLQKAKDIRPEADDLLTLLWEEDFEFFKYNYIDLLAEGVELPEASGADQSAALAQAHEEEAEDEEDGESGEAADEPDPPKGVSKDDFNPTLYSLDPRERQQLEEELDAEMNRDLRGDVLKALFDQLENLKNPERQTEIIEILRTVLPNLLSHGAVKSAADVLNELSVIRAVPDVLPDELQIKIDELLDELSAKETIDELLKALQDGTIRVAPEVLSGFLRHLRADALASLLRVSEEVEDEAFADILREAVRGIAEMNATALVALLDLPDAVIAAGAARLVGELGIEEAGPKLAGLMEHADPGVRLAAIEAAVSLNAASAASGLDNALTDPDRAIRIEAARAMGTLGHRAGAEALKVIVTGKDIRTADLTEKIAFFEAYGRIGDSKAFDLLQKLLNGKGFLGRREPPEIRACAAMALGVIGSPPARAALEKAREDDDAVVRNAVGKALRGGDAS
jgi:HEAT repeat protein